MSTDEQPMEDAQTQHNHPSATAAEEDSGVSAPPQPAAPALLLDSLPYLDQEYTQDEHIREQVHALLEEELSSLTRTPEEYLQEFMRAKGYDETFLKFETPALSTGLAALSSGRPAAPALDLTRYKLDPPSLPPSAPLSEQLAAWRSAIDNASAQLEHQTNRWMNLELLKKYGANAWKMHNEQLGALKSTLQSSLEGVSNQVETLNRKRKAEQVAVANDLQLLENGFYALAEKNHEIQRACFQLEQEIEARKKQQKV